jgi:hypothetical protein
MVERQLPKLHTGVRFPSPADFTSEKQGLFGTKRDVVRTPGQNTAAKVHGLFTASVDFIRRLRERHALRPANANYACDSERPLAQRIGLNSVLLHRGTCRPILTE